MSGSCLSVAEVVYTSPAGSVDTGPQRESLFNYQSFKPSFLNVAVKRHSVHFHSLNSQVAAELTAKDVVRAHARDELGIDVDDLAKPVQVGGPTMPFLPR